MPIGPLRAAALLVATLMVVVLTVNGGSSDQAKARQHSAYVYESTEPSGTIVSPRKEVFTGGLITGGNNKNGAGGICMQKGSTVTLNDVTIAGCRNQSTVGTEGTGGGVRIEGGDATLNMYDSTITGCFANNGGGIHVDAAGKATINLDDSHVDGNYAKQDGGGIYLFGKGVSITGSEDSTVSRNFCTLHGGGIHVFNSKVTIQGIAVKGNGATDGGGICTRNDAIALRKLDIEGNTASTAGGGVCIVSDAATNMLKHLAAMDANGGRWKPPMMPTATPTPTPNPTTPASGTTKPTTSAKATPKSGDSLLNLGLLAVTLAAAAGATLIVTRRVRKGR